MDWVLMVEVWGSFRYSTERWASRYGIGANAGWIGFKTCVDVDGWMKMLVKWNFGGSGSGSVAASMVMRCKEDGGCLRL